MENESNGGWIRGEYSRLTTGELSAIGVIYNSGDQKTFSYSGLKSNKNETTKISTTSTEDQEWLSPADLWNIFSGIKTGAYVYSHMVNLV